MLPCKHSTFSEYKQFLAFSFCPSSFSKLISRFFFFCGIAKRKSEHKKFWKRSGIVPRRGGRLSPYGLSSLPPSLRYGVASPRHFDSIPWHTMCRKSTSVTVQTLYLLRIQTVPCISLHPFFIIKTLCPAFSFFAESQKEKANIKSFGKG